MNLNKLLLVCCFALHGICKVNALDMDVSNYWSLNGKSNTPNNKEQIELETQLIDDVCGQWIDARRMHYAGKKKDEGGWVNGCMHNGQYESWDKSLKNIGTLISIALNDKQIVFDRVNWDTNPNAEALRNGMWMQKFIQMVIKEIKNNKNKDLETLKKEVLKKFYEDEELNKYARTLHDMHSYIDTLDVFKMITTTMRTSMLIKQMPEYEKKLNEENNFSVEPIVQNNGYNNCYETSLFQIVNALDPKQIDDEGLKNFKNLVTEYRNRYDPQSKEKLDPREAFNGEFYEVWIKRQGKLEKLIKSIKSPGKNDLLMALSIVYGEYVNLIYSSNNNAKSKLPSKSRKDLYSDAQNRNKHKNSQKSEVETIAEAASEDEVSTDDETKKTHNDSKNKKTLQDNVKTQVLSMPNKKPSRIQSIPRDKRKIFKQIPEIPKSSMTKKSLFGMVSEKYGITELQKEDPDLIVAICQILGKLVANYNNIYVEECILNAEQKTQAEEIITIYEIYTLVKSRKTSEIGDLFNRVAAYYNIYQREFTDYIDGWYRTDLQDEWTQISEKDFGTLTIGSIAGYESNNIGDSISNAFNVLARNRYAEACRSKISINKYVRVNALIDKIFFSNIPYYQAFPAMCGQKQLDVNLLDVIKRNIAKIYTDSINGKIDKDEIIREKVLERLSDIISKVRVSIPLAGKEYEYKINGKTLFENLSKIEGPNSIVSTLRENGFTTKNIDNINNELENRYVTTRIKKYPKVFIKMIEERNKEVVAKTEKLLANHDYLPVITPEGKILIYRLRGFVNYTDSKLGKHYNASIYTGSEWCTVDSYYEENNSNGKNDRRDYYPVFYMYQLIYEG